MLGIIAGRGNGKRQWQAATSRRTPRPAPEILRASAAAASEIPTAGAESPYASAQSGHPPASGQLVQAAAGLERSQGSSAFRGPEAGQTGQFGRGGDGAGEIAGGAELDEDGEFGGGEIRGVTSVFLHGFLSILVWSPVIIS